DRPRSPVEHRAMSCAASTEMMPLHEARESAALAGSNDVNAFVRGEDAYHHLIAGVGCILPLYGHLSYKPRGCHVRFLEVTLHRFADAFGFHELDESQLYGVVAVVLLRLLLDDDAGAGLDHGYGYDRSVLFEQLRHSNFLAQQPGNH